MLDEQTRRTSSTISENSPLGVLVTGSRRGIGLAVARLAAESGYHVIISDINLDDVNQAVASLRDDGLSAEGYFLDVTIAGAASKIIEKIERKYPLWGLVNNAGVNGRKDLSDVSESFFDDVVGVNVKGLYFTLQAAARVMVPRGRGSIVNIASTSGFISSKVPATVYDLSKGAVRALTVAASRELASTGVRINAVAPGTIATNLVRVAREDNPGAYADIERQIPLGRFGQASEVAEAVCFLLSDRAKYILGHTLVVDGGWLT